MPGMTTNYECPPELVLGKKFNARVPEADQIRQLAEVTGILRRLRNQPGVILADEVGMGKTFVALSVAYSVAVQSKRGPAIVMAPANLVDKWEQDLKSFCELYLVDRHPVRKDRADRKELTSPTTVRYGVARHSVELMKMLDDPASERCHMIFVPHGAMARRQTDKWIRLALIAEALRVHGRGRANRLIQVKRQIHRFLAELLWAIGEQRAHDWGEDLWQNLLQNPTEAWKSIYNESVKDSRRRMADDPVPKSVSRALNRIDLAPLAAALKQMPVRARGGEARVAERIRDARGALRQVEEVLWKDLLAQTRWRSPLLVMDEAHHLKNPGTSLARQLQSPDSQEDLRTGDGAMARAFDRMLFLTATPFQLGHHELLNVLCRFGDVRWETAGLGSPESYRQQLSDLGDRLDDSQRTAVAFQRSWGRLRPEDCEGDVEAWWNRIVRTSRESLNAHQRAVVDAYGAARRSRDAAQTALQPWLVRHNKGAMWAGTTICRRQRIEGAAVAGHGCANGLSIPPEQLLPFFLAARSAVIPGKDLLGEALCSSYEAFRLTRQNRAWEKDEQDESQEDGADLTHSRWYLEEFDAALARRSGATHPKVFTTIGKVADLWETGEKVLVFAFYRKTCRALRIHISREIERRIMTAGKEKLREAGLESSDEEIERLLKRIQKRYFGGAASPERVAIDDALGEILRARAIPLDRAEMSAEQLGDLMDVMRKFLRVPATIIRCFPMAELDSLKPQEAVTRTLNSVDGSGVSWRHKFEGFLDFLTERCSSEERRLCLDAAKHTQTGGIRVESNEEEDLDAEAATVTLANVQVATGTTRRDKRARLMRAFNTPFFPDILICSEVMGEGVDLQRFCRHVIHHDLDWNPSRIEQRTGRVDRLGCKAEGYHPIEVYIPYLSGAADERQFKVMSDREQWFRVVMGQHDVARLITPQSETSFPLPSAIADELSFKLELEP